jgi:hypothetical protein
MIQQRTLLKRYTPIRKVSKRRARMNRAYSKLRKAYLEEYPTCQVCQRLASSEIHHLRGRTGERLNDTTFWLALCSLCHDRIHRNPLGARNNGLMADRLAHD